MANGAVAAINGDFFDSTKSSAPDGLAVAAGELVKSFDPISETQGTRTAGVGVDGVGRLRNSAFSGELALPGGRAALSGLNRFKLGDDEIGLYSSRWGEHPRAGRSRARGRSAPYSCVAAGSQRCAPAPGTKGRTRARSPPTASSWWAGGRGGTARRARAGDGGRRELRATFDAPLTAPFVSRSAAWRTSCATAS
jgi:hypothetical protein